MMPPKTLLLFGLLSSLLYVALNIVCPLYYPGYSWISQTVSELSAIGAPTRPLWFYGVVIYILLVAMFAWGILKASRGNRSLRVVGYLLLINSIIGLFWPPMHQRAALAIGEKSLTDTMHIVFTMITVPLMMFIIGFGAASQGKRFRIYSIATLIILIVAGVFTSLEAPNIDKDLPTPWIGVWERVNIGVYMIWIAVLSVVLRKKENEFPTDEKGTDGLKQNMEALKHSFLFRGYFGKKSKQNSKSF